LLLAGCQTSTTELFSYLPDQPACETTPATTVGDVIPVAEIDVPFSETLTNPKNFIQDCLAPSQHPLVLGTSEQLNHHITFSFDAIYPISTIEIINLNAPGTPISRISVDVSTNQRSYLKVKQAVSLSPEITLIDLENVNAKTIRLSFIADAQYLGVQNIRFRLGEGFIVNQDEEFSSYFLRQSGWTGADGIFSYDLNNGGDRIGVDHQTTGFVFSDTFVGEVDATTYRRKNPTALINNSFGYLNHQSPINAGSFTFDYKQAGSEISSVLTPEAYTGNQARNLLDSDGFIFAHSPAGLITNQDAGIGWISEANNPEIIIDLFQPLALKNIYIWNYNHLPDYGVKNLEILGGIDGESWINFGSYLMPKASGQSMEPYHFVQRIDTTIRYLKITIIDGYDANVVGLSKLILTGQDDALLFGEVFATSSSSNGNDVPLKPRLWLQDGFVNDNKIYNFPLLVKNTENFFSINSVGMVEMDIVDHRFAYQDATYYSTPLMTRADDNGVIFFGAGVMDHRWVDDYIYVYGYKDLRGRNLIAARFKIENLHNFNQWEYYSDAGWVNNIHRVKSLINEVSAELSVTYIAEGMYEGKFMLTVMKNTTSGTIAYALGDTPVGPFSAYKTIYQTYEHQLFKGGYTYNAKLHPNLSTYDQLRLSYNVNSFDFATLWDARVYYPRFLKLQPVQSN
jgi:hypothetical protein